MKLDEEQLSDLIPLRSAKVAIPSPCLETLEKDRLVPRALLDILATYNFEQALCDPGFYITSPDQLRHIDTFGFDCLAENLLPVGTNDCGDFIVIDVASGGVGFLSHDKLKPGTSVRGIFVEVAESIGTFCERALADENFPKDYWDAIEKQNGG